MRDYTYREALDEAMRRIEDQLLRPDGPDISQQSFLPLVESSRRVAPTAFTQRTFADIIRRLREGSR